MTELADMFTTATQNKSIKALLSSRPLTAFIDCFTDRPQLELQHLTHNDITAYVSDRLLRHPQIASRLVITDEELDSFVGEIEDSASGVFLWDRLVVSSLLDGIQDGDRIDDLQRSLRALPHDLEDLFTHMLKRVPAKYRAQAACIFQILRCNNQGVEFSIHHGGHEPLSACRLHYAEISVDEILAADIADFSDAHLRKIEEHIGRRLRSHCAGLLELWPRTKSSKHGDREEPLREQQDVSYLHRCVADFLSKTDVWEEITSHVTVPPSQVSQAVLQSFVMTAKTERDQDTYSMKRLRKLVSNGILFAQLTEAKTGSGSTKILNELDKAMSIRFQGSRTYLWYTMSGKRKLANWNDTYKDYKSRPAAWQSHPNFMSLTVRHGLTLYVEKTIRARGKNCLKKQGRTLLDYACRPVPHEGRWSEFIQPGLVGPLLPVKKGADPNKQFDGLSAWQHSLYLRGHP
ncbi:uncharacterized protein M421DRAFT_399133 [Didymella exigua CBS 183.55]|uniref:DUF7791 domain-containing protein n=1 Tax=Didymella exigua CBS 183.55 TaxID=1150837 RepID=A0A6A5S5E2_9PLEO|nr:uncharacterized protein M421DRAFT_399133 [Didymella exigua CBS 183.55]KAF1932707.1 hypothetical protein M421DRAFT_399133 [Didymella exigua CBS 183.55]